MKAFIQHRPNLFLALIFGLGSAITSYTFVIPFLTTVPAGALVEGISSLFAGTSPYSKVGFATLSTFAVLSTVLIGLGIWLEIKSNGQRKLSSRVGFFVGLLFVFHPLAFYVYWWWVLDFRGDGQLVMVVVETAFYGSFLFAIPGLLLDLARELGLSSSTSDDVLDYERLKATEQEQLVDSPDESAIEQFMQKYQKLSQAELQKICWEKGWTHEARIAAKQVLDSRHSSSLEQ